MPHYQTTKLCYFTNTKDKTPFLSLVSHLQVCLPKSCYVGETDRTLHEGTKEHVYAKCNRMNKVQFMNICHHVPITATLQVYSRLTPIALIATSLTYRK